jgi:glycosyltransferase involved in cell wall biosynthesis
MKTILFSFGISDFTGANKMGYSYVKAFLEEGYRVVAVSAPPLDRSFEGSVEYPSVNSPLLESGVHVIEEHGFVKLLETNLIVPKLITRMARIIKEQKAICTISMQQFDLKITAWASRLAGVPCIFSAQNRVCFKTNNRLVIRIKERALPQTLKRSVKMSVCTSVEVRDELHQVFGYPIEKTIILPNGIDVSGFPKFTSRQIRSVRREWGIQTGEVVLINVGRLHQQKGQHVLIEAFAQANFKKKKVKLVLIGNPSAGDTGESRLYAKRLNDIVREKALEPQVIFAGWRNDVPLLLSAADIYVHSALWEGFPLAMLEGMAARLPIIGTDCSGPVEGFQNGVHGYIVPKGQAESLAHAMESLVALDSTSRHKMGVAARIIAKNNFDIDRIGTKFVKIVEDVLHNRLLPGNYFLKGSLI